MTLPVVMVGAGGHAKVLLDVLGEMSCEVIGYINPVRQSDWSDEIAYLGGDEEVRHFRPDSVLLSNGVGSVASVDRRAEIFLRF
jgi:UDP-perosamine 4-acetyltransferase